jgi:7,8-dihydropterin-6-yl-methyl-4-(beta-D-ribofuranosyl)aminobenzene 5'-phosphate synthase
MKAFPPIAMVAVAFLAALADPKFGASAEITVTDVYDNYRYKDGISISREVFLGPHWGLACFIEGTEETILFDTGASGPLLQANIDSLGIDVGGLQMIVMSHNHPDHRGGLAAILQRTPVARVYFGMSFTEKLANGYVTVGGVMRATPILVGEPVEICRGVYLTGDLRGDPREQALILVTQDGLVVLSGCAHPGIVNTVKKAKEILGKEVFMVVGGFHLLEATPGYVTKTIQELQALGVQKVAPTHCTGDSAIARFREAYGQGFIPMGVGQAIHLRALETTAVTEVERTTVPDRFSLAQSYPNPFNSSTEIRFALPVPGDVELVVHNLAGARVAGLVAGPRGAGSYAIVWDGRDDARQPLASGVYLYHLQVGGQGMTRKLLLLR